MAAIVLNSLRAVEVSVYVVRAFVCLREAAVLHKNLADASGNTRRARKNPITVVSG
jgi:hypothetical protein